MTGLHLSLRLHSDSSGPQTTDRPQNLLGLIKYEKDIKAMNAEIYLDSVLYRDIAYEVEAGFI